MIQSFSRSRLPPRAPLAAALVAALALTGFHAQVWAGSTIPVTDCGDSGAGATLRNAIAGAMSGDSINASACMNSTITLSGTEIAIPQSTLTIFGPNDNSLTIDANHLSRVFDQTTGAGVLNLQHLKVQHGSFSSGYAYGGCVYSKGSVVLQNTTITGCSATSGAQYGSAFGGGVFGQAVTIDHSIVSGNSSVATGSGGSADGGGVMSQDDMSSQYSTISGNSAIAAYAHGGGIYSNHNTSVISSTIDSNKACAESACSSNKGNGGGVFIPSINATLTTNIVNSTISGNVAGSKAGGIYEGAKTTTIYNTTIAFNTAAIVAGGIYIAAGVGGTSSAALQSSIIANNKVSMSGNADLHTAVTPSAASANDLIVDANQSPLGTPKVDPQLGPLASHGGLTRTHALNPASPAVDGGNNVAVPAPVLDQRGTGYARVVGRAADIGAYERQVNDDEIFYSGLQ